MSDREDGRPNWEPSTEDERRAWRHAATRGKLRGSQEIVLRLIAELEVAQDMWEEAHRNLFSAAELLAEKVGYTLERKP